MPQIDFYVAQGNAAKFSLRTACRLAEKAFHAGLQVHILTKDKQASEELDALLWTFKDRSFVPHQISDHPDANNPVSIGPKSSPQKNQFLINISGQLPENISEYQRIAEIIDNQIDSIHAGRKRYRFYREQGFAPQHHEVS